MSKYNALWEYAQKSGKESFQLTFEEIQEIAGIPIDHSFLKYKKELAEYKKSGNLSKTFWKHNRIRGGLQQRNF